MSSLHQFVARIGLAALIGFVGGVTFAESPSDTRGAIDKGGTLDWHTSSPMPPLPDPLGVAGAFIGVHNDALIVAGGTTFDKPGWEGGEKLFRDAIHVLIANATTDSPQEPFKWRDGGSLPLPIGHGTAVSTPWGLVCLGGTDGQRCRDEVQALRWHPQSGDVEIDARWPNLPIACEKLAATVITDGTATTIYVAGGATEDGQELSSFYCLTIPNNAPRDDIAKLQWKSLPPWPGPPRFGAALVAQHDGFSTKVFLFGGKHRDVYLTDGYSFDPARGEWSPVAPMPRPALLAAAIAIGPSHLFLFSGSDGHDVDRWQEIRDDYRFTREVLAYHTITDTWTRTRDMPTGVAATAAVEWQGGLVIPGGELRPTVRTREVQFARISTASAHFGAINLTVLALYLISLLGVGIYFSRGEHSTEDFFLAGRRIPWWAAGLSLMATQVSSIGFLAVPAKSFATNWTYFAGVFTWFLVVPIVTRVYIPFFRSLNVTTAYEYLEVRFNYAARLLAAITYCLLQLGRMGVVLLLPSLALAAVTGLDVVHCILIMGVVATVYTVAGGMEAVIWTDVVQAILLLGGAIVCILVVVMDIEGGWSAMLAQARSDNKLDWVQWGYDPTQAVLWVIVVGNVLTRLSGLTADQAVVQRYLTTKDTRAATRALWLDVAVSIPWAIIVFGMGTAMYVFYKNNPSLLNPTAANDAIVPLFIAQQLPVGVAGLVVAAVFAAAMSSLDSSMHSVATVYLTDVHNRFWPHATQRQQMFLARSVTALLGCFGTGVAVYMAAADVKSLWDTFLALVGAVAGVLAGLFILGMFTTRANGVGAVVGAIVGGATMYAVERHTSLSFFLYPLVGIGVCFVAGYLASLVLPGPRRVTGLTVFTTAGSPFTAADASPSDSSASPV